LRKLPLILSLFLVIAGICTTAEATPYTITDITYFTATGTNAPEDYVSHGWGAVDKLDGMFDYVKWQHQYTFNPPLGTITSASIAISLIDDEIDRICRWFNTYEIGIGFAESGQWDFGEIDTGTYAYNVNGAYLGDGSFFMTIASLGGDFSILSSTLTIDYDSTGTANAVPEPTYSLFLGTGLLGLAALGRKRLLKK